MINLNECSSALLIQELKQRPDCIVVAVLHRNDIYSHCEQNQIEISRKEAAMAMDLIDRTLNANPGYLWTLIDEAVHGALTSKTLQKP